MESRGPSGGLGGVETSSRRCGRGWGTFSKVQLGAGGPPGGSVGSGGPPGGLGRVGRPSQRFGRGWDVLQEVWEALVEVRDRSECPPAGMGGVVRPSRSSGKGREALPEVRKVLGCPLDRGVSSVLSDVRKALAEVREGSGRLPRSSVGVGRPFRRFRRGPEALSEVWKRSGGTPKVLGAFGTSSSRSWRPCRRSGGVRRPSWSSRKGREALPEV